MVKYSLALTTCIMISNFEVFASSCCGSSQANTALILSEQRIVLRTSLNETRAIGRVFDERGFYEWDKEKNRVGRTIGFSSSYALSEKDQVGLSSSITFSTYGDQFGNQNSSDFGDLSLSYSHKIKNSYFDLFLTSNVVLPTGRSPYEGNLLSENANVTGFGQYGLGLGTTAYRFRFPFTTLISVRLENYFSELIRDIKLSNVEALRAASFFGYSFNNGYGLGGGFSWSFLSTHTVNGYKVPSSNFTSLDLSISKTIKEKSVLTLMYSDQTLIGASRNSILNRALTFNYLYNFY